MIIKSIQLKEVRKFSEPVRIAGIKNGLNVLSAENEYGKSTFVDALYAVLFENYRTFSKYIKKLVPSSGGNPHVRLEIEIDMKTYLVEKIWSSRQERKKAYIYENNEVIKVDDQAENWILENLKFSEKIAPTGLIWLRQGNVSYGKWEDTLEERKTLLSSITGEIENLTGGQTMDRLVKNYEEDLSKYHTKTGQVKTNSQYHSKLETVKSLKEDLKKDNALYDDLKTHISKRNKLKIKLEENDNPEEDKKNEEELQQAKEQLDEANKLEDKIGVIKQKEEFQSEKIETLRNNISTLKIKIKEEKEGNETLLNFRKTSDELIKDRNKETNNQNQLSKNFISSQKKLSEIEKTYSQIERALTYESNIKKEKEIAIDLKKIKTINDKISSLKNQLNYEINEKEFKKIRDIYEELKVEQSIQERSGISLSINYGENISNKISIDGKTLHNKEKFIILKDRLQIKIKDIGFIDVKSEQNKDHSSIKVLEDKLTNELLTYNKQDYDAALKSLKSHQNFFNEITELEIEIRMIAPNGVQALEEELFKIPKIEDDFNFEKYLKLNKEELETSVNSAKTDFKEKEIEKNNSEKKLNDLLSELKVNTAQITLSTSNYTKAKQSLSDFVKTNGDLKTLEKNLVDEDSKLNETIASLDAAKANVDFDIEMTKAQYSRIKGKIENKKQQLEIDSTDLLKIDALIKGMSGDGIHEKIMEIEEEIETYQRDIEAIDYEISVLKKLIYVLTEARKKARDSYLEPIIHELKPLLKLIWPEATIDFNDNYAPIKILREGKEEPIELLSLGTQEQISIFVRLAFAKLFSNTHSSIPVIIDDAIIYSDDIRIKKIFTALHMQSFNYQIIVFSCRQKSFEELGGNLLCLEKVN